MDSRGIIPSVSSTPCFKVDLSLAAGRVLRPAGTATQHLPGVLHLIDIRHITYMKTRKLGFFSMLLALLGLGGCEIIMPEMYGAPSANFSVKGTVTDEGGNPIQDLEVSLSGVDSYDGEVYVIPTFRDPVKTDQKGTYLLDISSTTPFTTLQVNVKDVDGPANGGEFASDSARTSNYSFVKDKKDHDTWSVGTADITMPVIKLKKK